MRFVSYRYQEKKTSFTTVEGDFRRRDYHYPNPNPPTALGGCLGKWVGVDIAQWGRLEAAAAGAAGAVAAAAGASEEEKDIVEFVVLG